MPTDQTKVARDQIWRRHSDSRLVTILDATQVERGYSNPSVQIQGARKAWKILAAFRREYTYVAESKEALEGNS